MERYVIHTTKECNMACKYCYEKDKTSGDRSWRETKKLLDNILKYNNEFEIEFLGGEPLLNFSLIKKCVDYLKNKANVPKFIFTTNGTVLTKKILNFIKDNSNITLGISLDGTKNMNSLRVFKYTSQNSYDVVMKNLEKLKAQALLDRVFIHIVTHPYNVGWLSYGIDELYKMGYKNIDVGIVENTMDLDDEFIEAFIKEHSILSNKIKEGYYKDILITTLKYQPSSDNNRTYIRDDNGIVIAESYGREKDDLTNKDIYNIKRSDNYNNPVKDLKRIVYENHIKNLNM